jgi:hypothetical protein
MVCLNYLLSATSHLLSNAEAQQIKFGATLTKAKLEN